MSQNKKIAPGCQFIVKFILRYQNETDYDVWSCATRESYRVIQYDDGTYKTPVNHEVKMAIAEFQAYEHDDYLDWKREFDRRFGVIA